MSEIKRLENHRDDLCSELTAVRNIASDVRSFERHVEEQKAHRAKTA